MTEWLTYILATIGTVYLLTQSVVWAPIRIAVYRRAGLMVGVLLYCPSCTGFWVGILLCFAHAVPGRSGWIVGDFVTSGVMSMAIAQMWSALTQQGVNPAWESEQDLREPENAAKREPPNAS